VSKVTEGCRKGALHLKLFSSSFSAFSKLAAGRDLAKPFRSKDSMKGGLLAEGCELKEINTDYVS
jgi:hypothetical protein